MANQLFLILLQNGSKILIEFLFAWLFYTAHDVAGKLETGLVVQWIDGYIKFRPMRS